MNSPTELLPAAGPEATEQDYFGVEATVGAVHCRKASAVGFVLFDLCCPLFQV